MMLKLAMRKTHCSFGIRWYSVQSVMKNLRSEFDFGNKASLKSWFPPHMWRGQTEMKKRLKNVDCIIEVHDARIPFSGRNPILRNLVSIKPRLIVLNKSDLIQATEHTLQSIYRHFVENDEAVEVLFTNCSFELKKSTSVHSSMLKIMPACLELIKNSPQYNRYGSVDYQVMVVGIPNVGKSSLIQGLRHQYLNKITGVSVDSLPGHTKSVSSRLQIYDNPRVFVFDTPGILPPKITHLHSGMKLAACNTISKHAVDVLHVADYILYLLNQKRAFQYVDFFEMPEPCDNISAVLLFIAQQKNFVHNADKRFGSAMHSKYNVVFAAEIFVDAFRKGNLGRTILDDIS